MKNTITLKSQVLAMTIAISAAAAVATAGSSCSAGSGSDYSSAKHSAAKHTKVAKGGASSSNEKGSETAKADIVDTAVSAGSFGTLVAAVKAADLVDTLKGKGPFTVFAPTDDAFAKLPKGTVEELLKPENKSKLTGILTYHVVPGQVMAKDVVKLTSAKTVNGKEVSIKVEDDKVYVDGAQVVKTDIKTANGVIHVIDSVILPQD